MNALFLLGPSGCMSFFFLSLPHLSRVVSNPELTLFITTVIIPFIAASDTIAMMFAKQSPCHLPFVIKYMATIERKISVTARPLSGQMATSARAFRRWWHVRFHDSKDEHGQPRHLQLRVE